MPRQTQIEFRDFIKAIEVCARQRFGRHIIKPKRGSAIRIELFRRKADKIPCEFWVVHRDKYVYTKDLKKAYTKLGVSKKEFLKIIDSL